MTNLEQLIRLNVELEGILRVLQARQSDEALTAAREKFAKFSTLFGSLTDEADEADAEPIETDETDESYKSYTTDEPDEPAEPAEPTEAPMPAEAPATDECIMVEDYPAAQTAMQTDGYRDIRRNLTLNDKFMFKRELFNDSIEEFNDTLDLISAMNSYDEALEYLCDDLAWDPENPAVKEFLNLAANYFNVKH